MITGIDVSSYQSETYSLTGVDFVVVKATEGTTYTNPRHAAQVKRARDNGRVVGHYHYLTASASMTAQMDHFLEAAAPRAGEILAVDWEETGVSGAQKDAAVKYLKSKAGGRRVLLYCSQNFWLTRDTTGYAGDGLWIAQYNGKPGKPGIKAPWVIHQYTDSPLDTDVANFSSRSAMAAWAQGTSSEDDMPQYVNLGLDKPYTLRPGGWDSVEFTKEWTDEPGDHATGGSVWARGACRFTGSVSLTFEGLPEGAVVQARMSEYAGDQLRADHPIHEIIGTAGDTFAVIPLTKRLAAGHGMRVRLMSQAPAPITVKSAVLTVLTWKEG